MSHIANLYAKHLSVGPTGERVTVQEKAVLTQLADDHREDAGCAWPSVGSIAKRACLSIRQAQRVIASLERKNIIARRMTWRESDHGQSSNEYVFTEIAPSLQLNPEAEAENRRRLQSTKRSYVQRRGMTSAPPPITTHDVGPDDISAVGGVTSVAPLELSIDPLREEKERIKEKYSSPIISPVVTSLPLNTGDDFEVTQAAINEWQLLYPAVDVPQQTREMRGWLIGNPTKRKTRHGILRFITTWLRVDQNRARPSAEKAANYGARNPESSSAAERQRWSDASIEQGLRNLSENPS